MKKNIIIIGSSGHAKVVIDIVEKQGLYEIAGLIDPYRNAGEETLGYKILGKEEELPELINELTIEGLLIAIGDNYVRNKVREKIESAGMKNADYISAVHPNAVLGKNVTVGRGSVIMAGVVVNADSTIGDFTILNTRSSLDHDSVMKDYSSLAPGVTTGGNVTIGKFSAVSLGAMVKHGVTIGENTVIGAGSVVVSDIGDNVVAFGVPAKTKRERKAGESYL